MDPLSSFPDVNKAQNSTNKSTAPPSFLHTTTAESPSPGGLFSFASSLWILVISSPAFREGVKFIVLGGALDAARHVVSLAWAHIMGAISITAEFEEKDETYTWMMFWLSRQQSWRSSHNVIVTTHRFGQSGVADCLPGEDEEENSTDPNKRLTYIPTHNRVHYMWHKYTLLCIKRSQTQGDMWNRKGDERLSVTLFAFSTSKLDQLLLEAKRTYKKESEGRINVHVADTYNEWHLAGSRPKRPLASVVLDKGIKENLLLDAKDFLESEKWYAERGIPWRRGYLLYGSPGAGKTSLIHSLAGELNLPIYLISLSKKGLDDSVLNELITKLPTRSLLLMEDIDAAFFRGVNREESNPEATDSNSQEQISPSSVTLSGLLGAIDGVAAQEGRLLFATTNKYSSLDPALVRPGRLDVHVCFEHAGKWQAEELFRCFYPPSSDEKTSENWNGGDEKTTKLTNANPNNSIIQADKNGAKHVPKLKRAEVERLAKEFAQHIPEREFSMAAIQGLLMQYKTRPQDVVDEASKWVEKERRKRTSKEQSTREGPDDHTGVFESNPPPAKVKVQEDEESKDFTVAKHDTVAANPTTQTNASSGGGCSKKSRKSRKKGR